MANSQSTTIVGVEELFYAIVTEANGVATYGTPKRLGYVQELAVAPQVESASQYADNKVIETATAMGDIEVEITLSGIEPEVEAEVLGHTYANGSIVKKSTDIAPYIALLYKRTKANGKSRFKALYKGKLALPEESNQTKQDSIEFQSSEFTASFMPRPEDNVYEFTLDEELATGTTAQGLVDPQSATYWTKKVPSPVAPTV